MRIRFFPFILLMITIPAVGVGGPHPGSVTLGDFDHDGDLDVAVPNSHNSTVSILLNDGTGSFGDSAQPETGHTVNWVSAGDFDVVGQSPE